MVRYIARRILFIIPVALLVSFMTFMIIHIIPGDPARLLLGEFATPQSLAALRQQLGLDKPLIAQFGIWLWQLFHGNLGQSIQLQQPVLDAIVQRLPVTLELGFAALIFSLVIAFPLGIYSATHRNTWFDRVMNVLILLPLTIVMVVTGVSFFERSWAISEQSGNAGGLPQWPAKSLVMIGFALLLLQAISELIKRVAVMRGLIPDPHAGARSAAEAEADRLLSPEATAEAHM